MNYKIKLIKKELVADGTIAFHFTKPEGFEYKAGQNADYTLIDPPETDAEGNKRTFSFVSAPFEPEIIWTTRMRDTAFKRVIEKLPEGMEIEMEGPYGDMTLHSRNEKPGVFLAGGIGITPFYSMVKDAAEKRLPHKIFLFYSNRQPKDAAFLKELADLQKHNPNFKFIPTMTQSDEPASTWGGECGYITTDIIERYIKCLDGPIYYLAGPPGMITSMKKMLNDASVVEDDIRTEEFAGY